MGLLLLQITAGACTIYTALVPVEKETIFSTEFPQFLTEPQTEHDHEVRIVATLLSLILEESLAYRYANLVVHNATIQQIDPILIAGVIMQESRGDSMAVSSGSAIGLMQIIPSLWIIPGCDLLGNPSPRNREEHIRNLHHVEVNICYGTRILRFYLEQQKGNVRRALAKYSGNARLYPTRVLSYVGQAHILSTQPEGYYERGKTLHPRRGSVNDSTAPGTN
jgi:hypothetical protein